MYTEKSMALFLKKATTTATSIDLTSAAVAAASYLPASQVKIRRFGCVITTATVSTGNIVLVLKQYPVAGSSANAVTIATLNIPTATAAGKVVYIDVSGTIVQPGNELVFQVTTAAAGGGAAGVGYGLIEYDLDPETATNNSNMVLSS